MTAVSEGNPSSEHAGIRVDSTFRAAQPLIAPGAVFEVDMMNRENEVSPKYIVVVNHDEQYSIWPSGRAVPADWREAGKSGTKAECLAFIIRCVRT